MHKQDFQSMDGAIQILVIHPELVYMPESMLSMNMPQVICGGSLIGQHLLRVDMH